MLFVFSAANSDLYIASRTIYGLASQGKAPRILARTDAHGVPIFSLGLSALFCLLAFMNVSSGSKVVFGYFVNLATIFGLLTWVSSPVTHIFFVKARNAKGTPDDAMPYTAPFGICGSYVALFFCCLIAVTKNFITGYLGIPLYLAMILGYKYWHNTKQIRPETADMYSGKAEIDHEEEEFLAQQAMMQKNKKAGWFYRTFVRWLF